MTRHTVLTSFAAGAAALFLAEPAEAQLRLPSTFGSHMVLQQKTAVPFWGWASPSEEVKVAASWAKEPLVAKTSAQTARFEVVLEAPEAGGPYSIGVVFPDPLDDVMIGEVWFASGQSNMELTPGPSSSPEPTSTSYRPWPSSKAPPSSSGTRT